MRVIEYLKEENLLGNKKGKSPMTKYKKRKSRISRLWRIALKDTTFDEK